METSEKAGVEAAGPELSESTSCGGEGQLGTPPVVQLLPLSAACAFSCFPSLTFWEIYSHSCMRRLIPLSGLYDSTKEPTASSRLA